MIKADTTESLLSELIRERVLLLDGAMGTMIQRLKLDEAAVRGDRFADHDKDLKNFSDILCLTHPDKITGIHDAYYEAGSDIVETNSFGASPIGMVEFGCRTNWSTRSISPPWPVLAKPLISGRKRLRTNPASSPDPSGRQQCSWRSAPK